MRSVCVFTGSVDGAPEHQALARAAGEHIARSGLRLVYGGGDCGLMGLTAQAALDADGEVLGVIPEFMLPREGALAGIELRKVATMGARKAMMIAESDAFLALPGGGGTLEEIFDVVTRRRLGVHAKLTAVVDRDFWGPLETLFANMRRHGFAPDILADGLIFADTLEEAFSALAPGLAETAA